MPVRPRMQGWPVGTPLDRMLLFHGDAVTLASLLLVDRDTTRRPLRGGSRDSVRSAASDRAEARGRLAPSRRTSRVRP